MPAAGVGRSSGCFARQENRRGLLRGSGCAVRQNGRPHDPPAAHDKPRWLLCSVARVLAAGTATPRIATRQTPPILAISSRSRGPQTRSTIPRRTRGSGFRSCADGAHATSGEHAATLLDGATIHLNNGLNNPFLTVTPHRRAALKHKAGWRSQDFFQALRERLAGLSADLNSGDPLDDFGDMAHIGGNYRQ